MISKVECYLEICEVISNCASVRLKNRTIHRKFVSDIKILNNMFPEDDNKVTDSTVDAVIKERNVEFDTSLDHGLSKIKCEFEEEETRILYGDLENQLLEENDVKSLPHTRLLIIDGEFPGDLQKTELAISFKENVKIEYGEVKSMGNENNEELATSLNNGLANIKCEFDEEKTNIQFGDLENQLHKEKCSRLQILNSELSVSVHKIEAAILTNNKSHICEFCLRCFSRKEYLNRHMSCHIGEKPFKCDTCSQFFSRKDCLNRHMRIHIGEKPFKCETCSQCFTQKEALTIHNRIHTGEKPFKCEICSQCFRHKQALNIHNRIHTGKKPFKCETCGQCFSQKISLNNHNRIHTGEKPYTCEVCGHCCSRMANLTMHMKIHTGEKAFKCELCSQCFSHKGDLKRHITIHTGKKPFKCETCNKCFSQKRSLNTHNKIHTGEKHFKCEICSQCFGRRDILKNHIFRIHALQTIL